MASSVVLALCAILGYFVYSNLSGLRKNIAAAKRSGLPYMIARKSGRLLSKVSSSQSQL